MSLFTRLFIRRASPHRLIAPHPRLAELRSRPVFLLLFAVFCSEYFVFEGYTSHVFLWPLLFPTFTGLLSSGYLTVLIRRYKRIERLRFVAAQGDQRLLADRQPQPHLDTLPLPTEIAARSPRMILFIWCFLLFVLSGVGFGLIQTTEPLDTPLPLWPLLWALFLGGLIAIVLASMWRQRWLLEVKQTKIRSQIKNWGPPERVPWMTWQEACLFACYPRPGLWPNRSTIVYEISSANEVVSWSWVQRREPLSMWPIPIVSFEEHHAQMQALCDLVAAKTGLPLYDLSKG